MTASGSSSSSSESAANSASGNGRPRRKRVKRLPEAVSPAARASAPAPAIVRAGPPGVSTESLLLPLYETIGNPNGWAGFLDALSHAYGGSLSCITSYDFANRTGVLDASSGADKEFETSYVHHYARLNPWMAVLERLPVGLATLSDNILPYADLQRTEFYNDWCRPQRVGGGVGGFVERNGRRVVAATLLLSRPIIDRDPAVLTRLEMLMPHLLWVSQAGGPRHGRRGSAPPLRRSTLRTVGGADRGQDNQARRQRGAGRGLHPRT